MAYNGVNLITRAICGSTSLSLGFIFLGCVQQIWLTQQLYPTDRLCEPRGMLKPSHVAEFFLFDSFAFGRASCTLTLLIHFGSD